jgi:protein-L-isoaspartate(D-aspartate) O-methyltransferase
MPRSQDALADLIAAQGLRDERIVEVFRAVDRADFVPVGSEGGAYQDRPVVLPGEQTTSQPSLIARMIDAAAPGPDDEVLEVGTGFGFQTALLAKLCKHVVSVERLPILAEAARANLRRAGISNVEVHVGDGWHGWTQGAPYDAIIVSAAAESLPVELAEQTAERGRLVIPVAGRFGDDVLLYLRKEGGLERIGLVSPARFVPLVREDR